ncbi:MAG: CHC2 zinc finger domain-containing protein [Pseudomonadota bacterium]
MKKEQLQTPKPKAPAPMHPERAHSTLNLRYLKSQVTIGDVLSFHGLDKGLVRKGNRLSGSCPLHGGDNPTAFRVELARGLWHCFTSCGGGDTVELVRKILGCSYAQAACHMEHLCKGPVNSVPPPSPSWPLNVKGGPFKPFTWKISLNPRTAFLQQIKGISLATASKFEAGVTDKSPFLKGTVAVRLYDLRGNPIGYCGRRIDPNEITKWGKWRFPRNYPKKETLFNAHRAGSLIEKGVVVVECPWAAMRLTQAGVPNVIALLGTTASPIQLAWLARAPRILLMLDGDDAGRKAAPLLAGAFKNSTEVMIHALQDTMEPEDLSDQQLAATVKQRLLFS